jgi:cation diffusion facilitator family transporter
VRPAARFDLPPGKQRALARAKRLEWITLAYLASAVFALFLTLGSSQAMKAAWLEDMLSFVPPIAFLVSARVARRGPDHRYPFGYHRATTIAYLCGSLALLTLGGVLLADSLAALIAAEHPTIGTVAPFGQPIWLGWLMLPALLYSAVPVVFIGRAKLKLARELHDKVLYADATMNKADWLTASAAMLGVVGIGFGLWWADAVAAAVISLDIAHDGIKHLRASVGDLMDRTPRTVDYRREDPLPERLERFLAELPWVREVAVRVREQGHVYFAEALVVAADDDALTDRIADAVDRARQLDWRLHELVLMPVRKLPIANAAPARDP